MPEAATLGTFDQAIGHILTSKTEDGFTLEFHITSDYADLLKRLKDTEAALNHFRIRADDATNRLVQSATKKTAGQFVSEVISHAALELIDADWQEFVAKNAIQNAFFAVAKEWGVLPKVYVFDQGKVGVSPYEQVADEEEEDDQ